jgi:tubulin monoglycylase TTLL3/8
MFDTRKGSVELFGYDMMVDEDCNPWLIEINSSPTMESSTPITHDLCHNVMRDTVKVMVDYHFSKKKKTIETGDFERIFKGESAHDNLPSTIGLDLAVVGTKVKKEKGKFKKKL